MGEMIFCRQHLEEQTVFVKHPMEFLRTRLKGTEIRMEREEGANGAVTVHATVDGLIQKFVFTPI